MLNHFQKAELEEKLYYAIKQAPRNAPALVELLDRARLRGMRGVEKEAKKQASEQLPKFDAMQALEVTIHHLPRMP